MAAFHQATKMFEIFLGAILLLSWAADLYSVLMVDTKFILVYRFQTDNLNPIEYLRFTNYYGKANKKRMPWHSET